MPDTPLPILVPPPARSPAIAAPHPDPAADPELEAIRRAVAELDDAAAERARARRAYRDARAALEATAADQADAEALVAGATDALLGHRLDIVRRHAEPDARRSRFLLCETDRGGARRILDTGDDAAALGRVRDRRLADDPSRALYLVEEVYVRIASAVRPAAIEGAAR